MTLRVRPPAAIRSPGAGPEEKSLPSRWPSAERARRSVAGATRLALAALAVTVAAGRADGAARLLDGLEARLSLGYDSNLLDASTGDRAAFASRDPGSLFVVSAMDDKFVEGEGRYEWRVPAAGAARPTVKLAYLRRQYLANPIKSADRYSLGVQVRLGGSNRASARVEFQPTIYERHRSNDDAQPGEPIFRPQVQRRTDWDAGVAHALAANTSIRASVIGSLRDERPPFDARDRHLLGGDAGVAQSLPWGSHVTLDAGYTRTRSRNDPLSPTDLSNREWTVSSAWQARSARLAVSLEVAVEVGWRRYTSSDPADATHFGRRDRLTAVVVGISRPIGGGLTSVTRVTSRSNVANLPVGTSDEDSYSDFEIESGIGWTPTAKRKTLP